MSADPVNRPTHYTNHASGLECIEITRHMNFNLGNAVKYLWRAGQKGDYVQDLEKAIWYLKDEISRSQGTYASTPRLLAEAQAEARELSLLLDDSTDNAVECDRQLSIALDECEMLSHELDSLRESDDR